MEYNCILFIMIFITFLWTSYIDSRQNLKDELLWNLKLNEKNIIEHRIRKRDVGLQNTTSSISNQSQSLSTFTKNSGQNTTQVLQNTTHTSLNNHSQTSTMKDNTQSNNNQTTPESFQNTTQESFSNHTQTVTMRNEPDYNETTTEKSKVNSSENETEITEENILTKSVSTQNDTNNTEIYTSAMSSEVSETSESILSTISSSEIIYNGEVETTNPSNINEELISTYLIQNTDIPTTDIPTTDIQTTNIDDILTNTNIEATSQEFHIPNYNISKQTSFVSIKYVTPTPILNSSSTENSGDRHTTFRNFSKITGETTFSTINKTPNSTYGIKTSFNTETTSKEFSNTDSSFPKTTKFSTQVTHTSFISSTIANSENRDTLSTPTGTKTSTITHSSTHEPIFTSSIYINTGSNTTIPDSITPKTTTVTKSVIHTINTSSNDNIESTPQTTIFASKPTTEIISTNGEDFVPFVPNATTNSEIDSNFSSIQTTIASIQTSTASNITSVSNVQPTISITTSSQIPTETRTTTSIPVFPLDACESNGNKICEKQGKSCLTVNQTYICVCYPAYLERNNTCILATYMFVLNLTINRNFTTELTNQHSQQYIQLYEEIMRMMPSNNDIKISSITFSYGSIIASLTIATDERYNEQTLENLIGDSLNNSCTENCMDFKLVGVVKSVDACEDKNIHRCPKFSMCIPSHNKLFSCRCVLGTESQITNNVQECLTACTDNKCKNNGTCDPSFQEPYYHCRCPVGFKGIMCEMGTHLSTEEIIQATTFYIVVGVGGGFIFLLMVILLCMCCKRHKHSSAANGKNMFSDPQYNAIGLENYRPPRLRARLSQDFSSNQMGEANDFDEAETTQLRQTKLTTFDKRPSRDEMYSRGVDNPALDHHHQSDKYNGYK